MILVTQGDRIVARSESEGRALRYLGHRHRGAAVVVVYLDSQVDGETVVSVRAGDVVLVYRLYHVATPASSPVLDRGGV